MAATLCWSPGAAVSHRAAVALWRLPGVDLPPPELTVPRDRRRNHACDVIVHWSPLPVADVTAVDGIPVTTPARTLIDIASVVPADVVEEALDDALRRSLVSVPRLRWRIQELGARGRQGIGVIRGLVAERAGTGVESRSVLETRLARALKRAGLRPVRQHPLRDRGRVVAVVDFAFPEARLVIEADGYKWHTGRARWANDLARRNRVTALGWRVLHITWADLHENEPDTIDRIRAALEKPG
jgi:very-short-patch-repair endonuclease